jgi:hypothetical protein
MVLAKTLDRNNISIGQRSLIYGLERSVLRMRLKPIVQISRLCEVQEGFA